MKRRRQKFYEMDLSQDIRYRGPLSYRHLKMIGWLLIAMSQVAVLLSLGGGLSPDFKAQTMTISRVFSSLSSLSLPFLLLANFAVILDARDGYKRQLMINGIAAGLIALIYLFIFNRYVVGSVAVFTEGRQAAEEVINNGISIGSAAGSFVFNVFLDLFLCTVFMFALTYRPRQYFQGKKIFFLRALAALPVLYEIASNLLRILAARRSIVLNFNLFPFLTTKPPIMFLVFVVMVIFLKNRERIFCKKGRTHQEYQQFLKTNRNSFHFAVFTAIVFAIAGILDFILFTVMFITIDPVSSEGVFASPEWISNITNEIMGLGIGKSVSLIPMAPLVLLFSYTKTYKNKILDMFIPVVGVVLIIFVYLEGIYQAIHLLPGAGLGFSG